MVGWLQCETKGQDLGQGRKNLWVGRNCSWERSLTRPSALAKQGPQGQTIFWIDTWCMEEGIEAVSPVLPAR